jgi:hypothetical protein
LLDRRWNARIMIESTLSWGLHNGRRKAWRKLRMKAEWQNMIRKEQEALRREEKIETVQRIARA